MRSLLAPLLGLALLAGSAAGAPDAPVSLDGFRDSIQHWQNAHDARDYPRLDPGDVAGIADNLLLHQRANGGWRENEDPLRRLDEAERTRLLADKGLLDASLDNRTGWTQVEYLAGAHAHTGDPRYRDGCVRGVEYLLAAQHPSGGFPHSFPSTEDYRSHVTFADDITPDTLRTLRRVAGGVGPFSFVAPALRDRAAAAVARGDACILRLQVVQAGVPTLWAGQYDAHTLEPTGARAFELPALVTRESVAVVRYLMSIESPDAETIRAVEAAVAWYRAHTLPGWRVETFAAEPVRYTWHTSTTDRRLVADRSSRWLWARFHDLETSGPFCANRDGQRVYSLAEVERERRTGYDWFGTWAAPLLETEYPAWRARLEAGTAAGY